MALPTAVHGQVLYNGTRSTVVSGPMYIWPEGNTFLFPSGLVIDHNGYLWANDLGSHQILKFAPQGGGFSIILNSNGFPISFQSEQDVARECGDFANQIAVDANNHLYYPTTGDSGNRGRCYSGAQENGAWFSGTDPLNVWGLALDSIGNAYLADPVTAAIWIYPVPVGQIVDNGPVYCVPTVKSDGTPVTDCHASPGVNDFQAISNIFPVSVAVDRYGNIFYATFTELWEGMYQGNGNYNKVKIAGGFNSVRALSVGRDGIVYVADAGNNRIVREVPTAAGWVQSTFNGLNHPSGVTLDDAGNLYVSDTGNFQVIKYNISAPSFGSQNVGTASGSMGLSFTVLPGTTLGSVAIVTNGATGQDFADAGSSTCTAQTYASPTNCNVNVKFTPMAAGSRGGAIVFYDASGNVLQTLRLSGQGVGPAPVFEASSIQLLTPPASYYNEWGATATDGAGNLYIPEPSADAVMVVAPGGATSTLALTSPAINPNDATASSTLNNPSAIAVDSVGSLLIADTGNNRIVIRQPTGIAGGYFLNNLHTPGFTLNGPQAVATDVSGNIFIADTGNNRIVEVLPGGAAKQFGPTVYQPSSLAVDSNGNVYFTITSQGRVYRISSDGATVTQLSASPESLVQATGIAVDAAGTVYVADQKFGAVEIPASGTPRAINLPWPLGGYTGPNGISLDPAGNLYFSASGLGVYKMARTGVSLGFATTKTGATSTDSPQTVLVENAGNQPLNISKISFPTDFPQASGDSAACTGSTTLASGAACDLPIKFVPGTGSTLSELVTLTDNAGNVAGATQSVSVNGTGVVGGQSQTIQPVLTGGTYTKTPSYPYSAFGPLVYIRATSGLPVTLTVVSGPGNFGGAVSSSTQHVLSFTAAGLVTIQATQPGNSTYAPAPPVTFTVTSTPATISLNTRHSSFTQVYGAASPTVTFLLSGLIYPTDQVYLTITGGASPLSPVGNDTLTFGLTGPMASSYKLDSASTTGTLVVSPAPLTVVANDQYMVAGSTVPTLGYSLVGLVNADTAATAVTGAPSLSTSATSSSPAGTYAINLGLGTLSSTNYSLTAANGVLNVFAPIAFGPVAVGSTGTANVSFEIGSASKFASAHGATNALGVSVFRDSNTACSAGICSGTLSFRPTLPGAWSGALNLFDNSYPENLLVSIPVSGTGTAPQAVFTPGLTSTIGSGLSFPTGIAVDANLNVYVADVNNNRVIEYPTGGAAPILIGSGLNAPTGVAVDSQFNVFITDTGNHRVVEVPAGGNPQAVLATGLNHAAGIAVDGGGNLYVADSFASAVYRIPSGGGALVPIGSGWISPFGITVDGAGNVFVADSNLNSVIKLPTGGGAPVSLPFTGLNYPSGVAIDAVGNLFVSDTVNHRIVELSAVTGTQIPLLTGLSYPYLLAIDRFGVLYIPDSSNNRVLTLNPFAPPSLGFVATAPAATSPDSPRAVSLQNLGNQPLQISTLTFPADFPQAPSVGTACTSSSTISAGNSCTLSIAFSPRLTSITSASTPLSELVALTDNNLNVNNTDQSVAVNGTESVVPPIMNAPAPNSTFGGSSVTFNWSAGVGPTAYELKVGTTGVGSTDIYNGSPTTSLSTTVSGIPANGMPVYVRLLYKVGATWAWTYYTYTESGHSSPPAMTSPAPSSILAGANLTFNWSAGAGPSAYQLRVGTTGVGSSNIYNGSSTTSLSTPVSGIPANGAPLYVRLMYLLGATWTAIDYTYTEPGSPTPPTMTSPAPSAILASSNVTFNWSTGAGPSAYELKVGTTGAGSTDVFNGSPTTSLSTAVSGIPANGAPLFVRLLYKVGATWSSIYYTYTEPGSPTPPAMTSPAPSSILAGSSVTFNWNAGAGPSSYELKVGTTGLGSTDVYNGSPTTALSTTVSGIPALGMPVYVRLLYKVGEIWSSVYYTYTESGHSSPPAMTSPASSTILAGSSVTFNWSAGAGPSAYQLRVGTTGVGSSNIYNGAATTSLSTAVSGIPANGAPVYVRLLYQLGATWTAIDYTYTEPGSPTPPAMTSPAPSTILASTSVTFNWSAGAGPSAYELKVGTTGVGSTDIYNGSPTTSLSTAVSGIPANGAPVYVRLLYKVGATWSWIYYTYTEPVSPTPPAMPSPAP